MSVLKDNIDKLVALNIPVEQARAIVKEIAIYSYESSNENTVYTDMHGYDVSEPAHSWVSNQIFIQENLVTNFSSNSKDEYEKAINMFSGINPNHGLYIKEEAFDSMGDVVVGYFSLWRTHSVNLTKFWELKNLVDSWS